MTPFHLKIVTPDGIAFDGMAESLSVRSTTGDLGILAGHTNLVVPLGMGRATIVMDGKRRYAACIGGMVSVMNGKVTLVPTTFEWAEDIDAARAEKSYQRAQATLGSKDSTRTDLALAEARLKRAQIGRAHV